MTEAHIKKFNESQTKYRIEGTFQGDYFQALAKIRAAAVTKTAPAVFHVVGEALPQPVAGRACSSRWRSYAKGPNGTDLADFSPARPRHGYFDYLGKPPAADSSRCRSSAARPSSTTTPTCWPPRASRCPAPGTSCAPPPASSRCARAAETKVYGFEVPVDWWFWYALLHEAGGSLLTPTARRPPSARRATEALQFWVDLVNKDKTMKQPPGKDYSAWEVTNTDFLNRAWR